MLKIIKNFLGIKKLPSYKEIYVRSNKYANEECNLSNFSDGDEILVARGHYINGYEQAIKDYINKNYNAE